jgi:hypothetical protein
LKEKITYNKYDIIWDWVLNEPKIQLEYAEIRFLIKTNNYNTLNKLVGESLASLVERNYFEKIDNKYSYVV